MDQYGGLLILAVMLVFLWLFSARTRRQQRRQSEIQGSLQAGSRVMTSSGLFATVVSVDDPESVVLEIAPGVHTTWVRAAIGRVLDETAEGRTAEEQATEGRIAEDQTAIPPVVRETDPESIGESTVESLSAREVVDVRPQEGVQDRSGPTDPSPG